MWPGAASAVAERKTVEPPPAITPSLFESAAWVTALPNMEQTVTHVLSVLYEKEHHIASWSDNGLSFFPVAGTRALLSQRNPRVQNQSSFIFRSGCGVIRLGRVVIPEGVASQL
jgi:hypothetical protein